MKLSNQETYHIDTALSFAQALWPYKNWSGEATKIHNRYIKIWDQRKILREKYPLSFGYYDKN